MNTRLLFVGLLILSIAVSACTTTQENDVAEPIDTEQEDQMSQQEIIEDIIDLPKTCENLGGAWLDEYEECEGISEADCTSLDGTFNECASACRHDPTAEMCTRQCVIVCSFA